MVINREINVEKPKILTIQRAKEMMRFDSEPFWVNRLFRWLNIGFSYTNRFKFLLLIKNELNSCSYKSNFNMSHHDITMTPSWHHLDIIWCNSSCQWHSDHHQDTVCTLLYAPECRIYYKLWLIVKTNTRIWSSNFELTVGFDSLQSVGQWSQWPSGGVVGIF